MQKARKRFKGWRRQQLHPTKRMLQSRAVGHLAGAPKTKQLDRRAHVPRAAPAFEAREPANGLFSSLEAALLPLPCCPPRTIRQLFAAANLHISVEAMDEHEQDAAAIEGLVRLLGRCIHKINRASRQEKRLNNYTHAQKEPPENVKKERELPWHRMRRRHRTHLTKMTPRRFMDEHQEDAPAIEDGIDKLLARCMRAIRKSRRQERRLCSALQTNQPVPGQIIHETQNRRNWLLARCSALLAFQGCSSLS
ncbi:uncharacterized protein [Dermacentor albipictus]|uniref:uncharacterized protein isoform X2 n=1 Tax=Dermacentor albipictus TaxID=60249 RepID=UPI0038FCB1D9